MSEPIPISQLEIVGYANSLNESMLPAVVPPVFRRKADTNRVYLPPYTMQNGCLWLSREHTTRGLEQHQADNEVTLFSPPLEARPDFELWIDQENQIQYEPIPEAMGRLQAIAEDSVARAIESLRSGELTKAKNFCRTAMCANNRLLDPLAIRAAIARKNRDHGQERLMIQLAGKRSTPGGFEIMIKGFVDMMTSPPCARPVAVPFAHHPIQGMAAQRAA